MDGLRWLLLVFGLLVIAGVYWYSRREKAGREEQPKSLGRLEPTLGSDDSAPLDDADRLPAGDISRESAADEAEPVASAPQKIVTLRIVARRKPAFLGEELVLSLRGIGMRHGKFGIFHRYDGNDESRVIFSAASLVEPGSFDLANIKEQEIPGISVFLVLPGPIDGVEAFDLMMTAAHALSKSLDAELLDEAGSTLSIQRERYLREEVIQYQHSNLVA